MEKTVTVREVREALIKVAWDANASRMSPNPLLVAYPNEVLLELFGKEEMDKHWIPDSTKKRTA